MVTVFDGLHKISISNYSKNFLNDYISAKKEDI